MAQRIRMAVRYDGTDFAGSQVQPGKRTVAGTLKAGLESLLKQPVKLDFASRTDAGVHADKNVCAFTLEDELKFEVEKLPKLLDSYLPVDLVVYSAGETYPRWHPRFDALSRTYVYRIVPGEYAPVDRMRYVWALKQGWDVDALITALSCLKGTHDFRAFSASRLEAEDSQCTLTCAEFAVAREFEITLRANRFLRHMVVRLVGALAKVGSGERSPEEFAAILSSGERFQFRPAPAQGLTLADVEY